MTTKMFVGHAHAIICSLDACLFRCGISRKVPSVAALN